MIRVSVQPEEEPITPQEVKGHLRLPIRQTIHDAKIESLITAARIQVEKDTRRAMITQTIVQTNDEFPCLITPMKLETGPVQSVTSVQYRDEDGDTQTWASSNYLADLEGVPARIQPVDGEDWPETDKRIAAVTVTYVAGYASVEEVPATLKTAMLQLIEHWFTHTAPVEFATRGGTLVEVPMTYRMLIDHERWDYVG